MACCAVLLGLVGIRCLFAWPESGSFGRVWRTLGGTPGVLLFAAVASYLAIGTAMLRTEEIWQPATAGSLKYHVSLFGVLVAAAVGGRAVQERIGADRLLRGVLVVLISTCAVILASPVLRDLSVLSPYRIPFRLTGAFVNPSDAGLAACATAALAAASLTNGGPRRLGWLGLCAGAASACGTASRTALVALGALAVVFVFINVRGKSRALSLLSSAAAGLVVSAGLIWVTGLVSGGLVEWSKLRTVSYSASREDRLCKLPDRRPGTDSAVLLAAKDALAGDIALNWSRTVPFNRWWGVTVDRQRTRVVRLDLAGLGLNGRIPPELGRLDCLVSLSLQRNRVTGSIPPELGNLARLKYLNLSWNALAGTVPPELAKSSSLEQLWLRGNRLHGPVPPSLGKLDLSVLRLSGNDFGSIPPELCHIPSHDLSSYRLCLPPPRATPALVGDRTVLLAAKEALVGGAPLNWSYATPTASWQGVTMRPDGDGRVFALDLRDMNLAGRIPPELGDLTHLEFLLLDGNRLTGTIPPELGNLTRLAMLSLDGNRLTGPIPPEIGNLLNIRQLWLADNQLTGTIPPEFAGLELLSLDVAGNDFDGGMPSELRGLRGRAIDHSLGALVQNRRLLLWKLGFEKAMAAPLFGHGLNAMKYMDGSLIGHHGQPLGPHNLYLTLLGDGGIVPLLLFLSAVVLRLRAQWGAPKSLARDATAAWIVIIALHSMAFQHLLTIGVFMFLAGLSVALAMASDDGDPRPAKA